MAPKPSQLSVPLQPNPKLKPWRIGRIDSNVCGIIMMSISPGQKTHISDTIADDAVAIWNALQLAHEAKLPGNRFNAYDDLFSIRKEPEESLSALIMRTEQAVHLIKNLRPKDFDINKLDEELQCMALIRALPEEFSTFASTLMLTNKLSKSDLVTAFHTEEVQRRRRTEGAANVAKANAAASKAKKTFYCTFHKKDVAHFSDRCYLNPDYTGTRPAWFVKPAASTAAATPQQANVASAGAPTLPALSDASLASNPFPPSTVLNTHFWNADTGATSHITPHRHWLRNYRAHRVPAELADSKDEGIRRAHIGQCGARWFILSSSPLQSARVSIRMGVDEDQNAGLTRSRLQPFHKKLNPGTFGMSGASGHHKLLHPQLRWIPTNQ